MKVLRFRPLHNVIIMCKSREKKLNAQVIQQKYLFFRILIVYKYYRITRALGFLGTLEKLETMENKAHRKHCFQTAYAFLYLNLQAIVGKKYIFGQIVLGFFVKTYLVCKVC